MSPIYKHSYYIAIVYSVLMIHGEYRNCSDMNITTVVPNTNLLRYIIPPMPASSNIFVFQKLNHLSFKFTFNFKDTDILRIMNGNNVVFQLMDVPPKAQYCVSMVYHIINEILNSDASIGHMRICYFNCCNLLIYLVFITS